MLIHPTSVTSDQFEVPDDAVALYVTAAGHPLLVRPDQNVDTTFHSSSTNPDVCKNCWNRSSTHFSTPQGLAGQCPRQPEFVFQCRGCGSSAAPKPAVTAAVDANTHADNCRRVPLPGDRPDGEMWPQSTRPRYTPGT